MKKIFYLCLFAAMVVTSCTKEDGTSSLAQPVIDTDPFTPVPGRFTQKVLVEELTAAWCGYCPSGSHSFHKIDSVFSGKAIGVAIHISDAMEDMELVASNGYNLLDSALFHNYDHSDAGYPNGSVNRMAPLSSPGGWYSLAQSLIGTFAKCGLAIDASKISGNTLTVTVHTGFASTLNSDYRLNVFLTESEVHSTNTSYDQHNYYSATGSSPSHSYYYYGNANPVNYYDLPPAINNYKHENVLRKLLTSIPFGDQIPVADMKKGNDYKKTFTVSLAGYERANCYIVAFVDKYGTDFLNNEHQVQNVQRVKVGQTKMWD